VFAEDRDVAAWLRMNGVVVPGRRLGLGNRALVWLVGSSVATIALWFFVRDTLPDAWSTAGSPELYLTGVAGALLLLVPLVFSVAKRGGSHSDPRRWFDAHVWCACAGTVLAFMHSGALLRRPPALLLGTLVVLVALGVWARLRGAHRTAATFGSKVSGFAPPAAPARDRLRELILKKRRLLARFESGGSEATFSIALPHVLQHPVSSLRYQALVREETRLLGVRSAVDAAQRWWRAVHILLALAFVLGLAVHVLTVTFFAGWAADYGPVRWWHVTAW